MYSLTDKTNVPTEIPRLCNSATIEACTQCTAVRDVPLVLVDTGEVGKEMSTKETRDDNFVTYPDSSSPGRRGK